MVPTSWHIQETADFSGDGRADLVRRNDGGDTAVWSPGAGLSFTGHDLGVAAASWQLQSYWHVT